MCCNRNKMQAKMLAKFNRRETERQKRNNIVAYTNNIYIQLSVYVCAQIKSKKKQ